MRQSPDSVGRIHFIGIGGIGMSGIAEILHDRGYVVQGSDVTCNSNVERLRKKGIQIFINNHCPSNVAKVNVVVISTAINKSNPEMSAAQAKGIPIIHRAEMLAEVMRLYPAIAIAGSHGKTTVTSLIAHIMYHAKLDPTVISGGIITDFQSNARLGKGEWIVAEADESDGSFVKLPATVGIITNIDPEHLDHYGSFDGVRAAFAQFLANLPFYGIGVLCWDHPETRKLAQNIVNKPILTYGCNKDADIFIADIDLGASYSTFTLNFSSKAQKYLKITNPQYAFQLALIGQHNVLNAAACIIVSLFVGVEIQEVADALPEFSGIKRRFTMVGNVNGVRIIDDYAHHPVEVEKTLEAARLTCTQGRVIAVLQPHRFTRLQHLMNDFAKALEIADCAYITPVYSAGEAEISGVNSGQLASLVSSIPVLTIEDHSELLEHLKEAHAGDVVVFMGAGSITEWAYKTVEALVTTSVDNTWVQEIQACH